MLDCIQQKDLDLQVWSFQLNAAAEKAIWVTYEPFGRIGDLFRQTDVEGLRAAIRSCIEQKADPVTATLAEQYGPTLPRVAELADEERRACFRGEMQASLEDNSFDHAELAMRGNEIGLDSYDVAEELQNFIGTAVNAEIEKILDDGQIDESEEEVISWIQEHFGQLPVSADQTHRIEAARDLYSAANNPLPIVSAPILLKKGEVCHHLVQADALEERKKTVSVSYSGPRLHIRVARGFSYNLGTTRFDRDVRSFMFNMGAGALCATNKRILWVGEQKSISIPISSIVKYETYFDGVTVRKGSGKPLFFNWHTADQVSALLISRVIEECRS